jgi:hypothetical protein
MKRRKIEMTAPKTVLVGDRVRYESAAGTIHGEVVAIEDRPCADNLVRPWIVVEHVRKGNVVRTSLSDVSLARMKFKVIFRDCTNYNALAERYAYEHSMTGA